MSEHEVRPVNSSLRSEILEISICLTSLLNEKIHCILSRFIHYLIMGETCRLICELDLPTASSESELHCAPPFDFFWYCMSTPDQGGL